MEAVDMAEIDPVKYGVLWERVQNYERRFDEMSAKMDKLETNVEKLVAMANQGRVRRCFSWWTVFVPSDRRFQTRWQSPGAVCELPCRSLRLCLPSLHQWPN